MPNQNAHDYLTADVFTEHRLGSSDNISTCSCCGRVLCDDTETRERWIFFTGPSGWNHCMLCYRIRTKQMPEDLCSAALLEDFYMEVVNG